MIRWKDDKEEEGSVKDNVPKGRNCGATKKRSGELLKTRAVLFLEQTPRGELARRVKE